MSLIHRRCLRDQDRDLRREQLRHHHGEDGASDQDETDMRVLRIERRAFGPPMLNAAREARRSARLP